MKKLDNKELAVAPEKLKDSIAPSSTSSRSRKKTAKVAPSTNEEARKRKDLATYVVEKYIKKNKIDFRRDMFLAYKLVDKFSSFPFWRAMPIKNQVDSMAVLWAEKSRKRVGFLFEKFKEKEDLQKKVIVQIDEKHEIGTEKVGEDFIFLANKKPNSIIDFCR